VGPCQQGMASPQVADGRQPANTSGSCECIGVEVVNIFLVVWVGGKGRVEVTGWELTNPQSKSQHVTKWYTGD
jgi:hypothetical protein